MSNQPDEVVNRIEVKLTPYCRYDETTIYPQQYGKYTNLRNRVSWLFNDVDSDDDDYETYVIGRHLRNHFTVKYITNRMKIDKLYLHCRKNIC